MLEFIKIFSITFAIFLVIELIWLTLIAKDFYQKEIGYIMSPKPNLIATSLFAILFVLGMVFFVINPAIEKNSWIYAALVGIFYGLITYSTYTLTNLATLKGWPLKVSIIDLIWGSLLGGIVSTISYMLLNLFI